MKIFSMWKKVISKSCFSLISVIVFVTFHTVLLVLILVQALYQYNWRLLIKNLTVFIIILYYLILCLSWHSWRAFEEISKYQDTYDISWCTLKLFPPCILQQHKMIKTDLNCSINVSPQGNQHFQQKKCPFSWNKPLRYQTYLLLSLSLTLCDRHKSTIWHTIQTFFSTVRHTNRNLAEFLCFLTVVRFNRMTV